MMSQANLSFDTKWIAWTIGLYILSGICWLPVVWLQIRLPQKYWRYARIWELLGYPAFCATVVIYFLMVLKPA